MNPVSQRLLSQQLASPQFKDPAEVVSWFGAMQAQEYKMMRWAVSMRTRKPSFKAFEKAFDDGRIIRTHLQRTTWQLVAGEDLGWMLDLCRTKALTGLRGWMHSNGIDIPLDEEKRISAIFAEAMAGKGSVQKEFLAEALRERGIDMVEQRFSYHLRLAEYSGLLCAGDLHPTKRTFRLVSEKVLHPLVLTREESVALLTRKYFRSHGPATLEDFAWWSGLGLLDCRRGIASLGDELVAERWKGREFHVHRDARTRGFCSGSVLLLPPFDEYLIGYKSRDVVLHPDRSHHAHNQSGIFYPIVALDGEIVGNWSPSAPDGAIKLFKDVSLPEDQVQKQLGTYSTVMMIRR
ncbi:MAG: AlkZ family DNA glycosylase [Bacteroidales bacterium]|nr:AlkZ family DNA glycosylase [Bacteroidales bacterium]